MNCSLRPVLAADALQVAQHGLHGSADAQRREQYATWVRSRIASGTHIGWFALDPQGAVIAGAGAVLLDWGPTRANPCGVMARIANVFTEEAWRRQGLSRTLLTAVMQACEARGVTEFNLAATPQARDLYASLGFEPYPAEMRRRVSL